MISLSRRRVHTGKGFRKLDMRAIAASEALLESLQQHPKVTIVDKVDEAVKIIKTVPRSLKNSKL